MTKEIRDLSLQKFNLFTPLKFVGVNKNKKALWFCVCDCGTFRIVLGNALTSGNTKSCGCLARSRQKGGVNYKPSVKNTVEYNSWRAIKGRCYDVNNIAYSKYGGSGILMDEDFKNNFYVFLKHIGFAPTDGKRYTVDRIDNSKGYVSGNIRWATFETQVKNRVLKVKSSTGIVGVHYRLTKKGHSYYVANWTSNGKRYQKLFSIDKLGNHTALECAIKCRLDRLIDLENTDGEYAKDFKQHLVDKLEELRLLEKQRAILDTQWHIKGTSTEKYMQMELDYRRNQSLNELTELSQELGGYD